MYRLAIFDLDGTILDTLDDLTDAANAALSMGGYPTRTKAEICSFVGDGIKKLIERALPHGASDGEIARVLKLFVDYYGAHCAEKTGPYAGIPDVLRSLRARGVKTAVLSNKADFATQMLAKAYFEGLFDAVAGEREREGIPKKPAPDGAWLLLRECGVTANEAVYIGDSEVDVLTAKNAGLDAILVSWGFRTREVLLESGATVIADTPKELENLILNVEKKPHIE